VSGHLCAFLNPSHPYSNGWLPPIKVDMLGAKELICALLLEGSRAWGNRLLMFNALPTAIGLYGRLFFVHRIIRRA
jgi:hypothetical protein